MVNAGHDGAEPLSLYDETRKRVRTVIGEALPAILPDVLDDETWRAIGSQEDLAVSAASEEVIRAKRNTMRALNLKDTIEDLLITLDRQCHMKVYTSKHATFVSLLLDRTRVNLAAAGHRLEAASREAVREELDRLEIEGRSGPYLDAGKAAARLGVSEETLHRKVADGELIAYRVVREGDEVRLPLWQFADGDEVCAWVRELTEAFGGNGWGLVDFVTVPRASLENDSYLSLLKSGNHERITQVLEAARRSNPD
jgi:excisionase family DNA binding protein